MAKPKTVAGTGADPTIQFATIEIDGEQYKLAFDFNAIARAEQDTGMNLLTGIIGGPWNATKLRTMFYVALQVSHPTMSIEDAGRLMRFDTIDPIFSAVNEAMRLSMPEKKEQTGETAEPLAEAS